ncbi:MAG: YceI family protein [Firmicutes bacterium]|nr:YceI family protein [Bacillota bacterium]
MALSRWTIDPAHTVVEFAVRHMMISTVKGTFSGIQGTILADPEDLTSASCEVTVDVNSINTREPQRDEHLRSPDFFDAANYPTITFRSRSITRTGEQEYLLVGDLTIRGVTREVQLRLTYAGQARDPWGNERIGFSVEGKINRKDFGLTWNAVLETGGVLVGDEVRINIEAEAVKQV